ncbi:MAG TPA: putative baseplate assembly protein [Thermoanaerobaculia bacterium]|nr:putative baseplate assembly protein [Thermoanaerobaculia bacterium]
MRLRDAGTDTCGCCSTRGEEERARNRPGQPEIEYRLGTHGTFLRRMLRCLSVQPELAELTVRTPDDPAIGLLDAWASVLDVLSFYHERTANEGYLRTATERRSVLELARSIGYELAPGVAASTDLVFLVESAAEASARVRIDPGVRVLSVPGQDESSQTFETVEMVEARAAWNAMKPRGGRTQEVAWGTRELHLQGLETRLQPGDGLLVVGKTRERYRGSKRWDFRTVEQVEPLKERGVTRVEWTPGLGHEAPSVTPAEEPRVFALRQRAALFGHNAPDWRTLPSSTRQEIVGEREPLGSQWPGFDLQETADARIHLDAVYPKVLPGSWVVLRKPSYIELYKVVEAVTDSRTDFTLTAKTTRLTLDVREHLSWFLRRETEVFIQSEELELAERPDRTPVAGNRIELDRVVADLTAGRRLVVAAKRLHVEVAEGAAGLVLTSHDGSRTAALVPGERLAVLAPPAADEAGRVSWRLQSGSGLEGTVTVQAPGLRLVPVSVRKPSASLFASSGPAFLRLPGGGLPRSSSRRLRRVPAAGGAVVEVAVDGLFLVAADGSEGFALESGERLAVESPPAVDGEARVTWWLRRDDDQGRTRRGRVVLGPSELLPVTAQEGDETTAEIAVLVAVESTPLRTTLVLEHPLANVYDRATLAVYGNVVRATHGETVAGEALGSGDAASANQRFALKKAPLTYVSAATASGAEAELEVRVDGLTWQRVDRLYGIDSRSESYALRIDEDGGATAVFGDGRWGARLPSGTENVVATYRIGIGPEGEVQAGALTLLQTRPLGVREVTNPLAATGSAPPETLGEARESSPRTVLTLDRIVSLRDFEDFAAAFADIGKALAAELLRGERRLAHLTVAAAGGKPLVAGSALETHLRAALDRVRDSTREVLVASYEAVPFRIGAAIRTDPRREPDEVLAAVRAALAAAFDFERRRFAQPVTAAEVVAAVHRVEGVEAVDLDRLERTDDAPEPAPATPPPVLSAHPAHWEDGTIRPAQLLVLSEVELTEMEETP